MKYDLVKIIKISTIDLYETLEIQLSEAYQDGYKYVSHFECNDVLYFILEISNKSIDLMY